MTFLAYFNKKSSLSLFLSFVITEKFVSTCTSIVCCCFTMWRYTKMLGQPVSFVTAKASMFAAVDNTPGKAEIRFLCYVFMTWHCGCSTILRVFSLKHMIERKSCHGNTFLSWLIFLLYCTKHKLRMCSTLVSTPFGSHRR